MVYRQTKKRSISLLIGAMIAMAGLVPAIAQPLSVAAEETVEYTNVLTDLQKDENFEVTAYPAKANDYSLQVIQIAESEDRELFVYVYQPSDGTKELTATSINISTAINDNLHYQNYALTLLNSEGVFDKYKVEDLTVKGDAVRYYDISNIYRNYDSDIDGATGTDNTVQEVGCEVGQLWTACTVNNQVSYSYTYNETITITDRWTGFLRYDEGFKLYVDKCDAWFIAFNTDRKIENLLEADVSYITQEYSYSWVILRGESETYGEKIRKQKTLTYEDLASNDGDGWFGEKNEWKRIQSVEDFLATEELTSEAETNVKNKAWVLRFLETDFTSTSSENAVVNIKTLVSEVTVLRLKFETDGKTYNLGVVDNKTTPDPEPDNPTIPEKSFLQKLADLLKKAFNWCKANWDWLWIVVAGGAVLLVVIKFIRWVFK